MIYLCVTAEGSRGFSTCDNSRACTGQKTLKLTSHKINDPKRDVPHSLSWKSILGAERCTLMTVDALCMQTTT